MRILTDAQGHPLMSSSGAYNVDDMESYTIQANGWTALPTASLPYGYSATVTANYVIGNDTVIELQNNQAVLFAQYGFAVGAVSGQNITIYSVFNPSSAVTLTIRFNKI